MNEATKQRTRPAPEWAVQKAASIGSPLPHTHRRLRRGVATVELALTVILLIAMAGACIDLGRFAYTYIAVTNACSEGASYGCMTPPTAFPDDAAWQAAVQARAAQETTGLNPPLAAGDFTVQLWQEPGHTHVCVRVTATIPFNLLVAPWPWLPSTMTCNGVSAMPPMP